MVMEPIQGNLTSFQLDLGHTYLFCVPEVTSVFFRLCLCCWGLSRVQSSISRLLMFLIGKTQVLCMQCRGIGPHLVARGSHMGFLELRQAPGVYSRVTTGMPILNGSLFSEVWTPGYV